MSIVTPTYNRTTFLPDAIGSVLAQSFTDWELIIVDDGSTDDTRQLVTSLAQNDRRLRLLSNTRKPGPAGARNTGIAAAKGDWVAFLDSDDHWEASKLATFVDALPDDSRTVLVGSDYEIVSSDRPSLTMKKYVIETMLPWWTNYAPALAVMPCRAIAHDFDRLTRADLAVSGAMAGFLWIHTSSVMVRREAVLRAGMFDERLRRTEDIDLWLKLSALGEFCYVDQVLATYHTEGRDVGAGERYDGQQRARRHTPYIEARAHLELLRRIAKNHRLTSGQAELLRHRLAAHHRMCLEHAIRDRSLLALQHVPSVAMAPGERHTLIRYLRSFAKKWRM